MGDIILIICYDVEQYLKIKELLYIV